MQLSDKKLDELAKQPKIETKVYKSPKGKYVVFQTILTETRSVEWMQTVLDNDPLDD